MIQLTRFLLGSLYAGRNWVINLMNSGFSNTPNGRFALIIAHVRFQSWSSFSLLDIISILQLIFTPPIESMMECCTNRFGVLVSKANSFEKYRRKLLVT